MFRLGSILWVCLVACAALSAAVPAQLDTRDVSLESLKEFTLFAEYAAAAYCDENLESPGTKVRCQKGNCPTVEKADTETLIEFHGRYEFGDVAGFLAADATNNRLVLSFRGTRSLSTWIANLDLVLEDLDDELCLGCSAHHGFWRSWQTVEKNLTAEIDSALKTRPGYSVTFTGHSHGAALATLGAVALRNAGYKIELYTYGSPRVGNTELAEYITAHGPNYRVTHSNDIVPRLPSHILGYTHSSPEYWITTENDVKVTSSDIKVIEGVGSDEGNAGSGLDMSIPAHSWYFVEIDTC
ncbi:alpha/beta-hydrolase [Aspergillus taichungensis]|uniref:feruloyl esterase n=1 Tax=Aspergillus taichungensis TaxID=482145 RepID=A0A2J5I698_9EURO|nr:alpha/beta-hydrolase [Aspergillus taichungensis]